MSAQGFLFGFPFQTTEAKVRARPSWQPLIVGCGGGRDTGGALVLLHERGIRPDAIVFADTAGQDPERRGEDPATYAWMDEHLSPWLTSIGFPPLTYVINPSPNSGHLSLYHECITNGVLPGKAYGYSGCSIKWKVQPQMGWVRQWAPAVECYERGEKPIKLIGYDAGPRDVERAEAQADEDRWHRFWYPLIEWGVDRRQCGDAIQRAGMPLPPKSSCFFCPAKKPREVLAMRERNPRLFDLAVAMERNARSRGGIGNGVEGLGRSFSWENLGAAHDADVERLQRVAERQGPETCMACIVDSEDAS